MYSTRMSSLWCYCIVSNLTSCLSLKTSPVNWQEDLHLMIQCKNIPLHLLCLYAVSINEAFQNKHAVIFN